MKVRLPANIVAALEATGLPHHVEFGKKHIQLRLDGRMVGVLSYGSSTAMRDNKHMISAIRRMARTILQARETPVTEQQTAAEPAPAAVEETSPMDLENHITKTILNTIRELPGATGTDIFELCSEFPKGTVVSRLNSLAAEGLVVRATTTRVGDFKGRKQVHTYTIAGEPKPEPAPSPPPKSKPRPEVVVRGPHELLIAATIERDALLAEVEELRAWKVDACKRHPDLAVKQEVLDARQMVAETLKEMGDHNGAAEVLAGRKDNSPIVRVTLRALGGS